MAEAPDDPKLDDDISKQLSKMLLQHQGINKAMKEGLFTMKDLVGLLQEYERRLDIVDNVLTESKLQHSKVNEILKENSKLIGGLGDVEKLSLQTRRDLAATYDAETQAASDLLLKRNMVATGLRGEYAQLLTTAMLQGDITDLNSKQGRDLVKNLQHRQHNNELLEHEGEMYEHVAKMQLEINEELEKFKKEWGKIKATTKAIFENKAFAKGVLFASLIEGAHTFTHAMHEFKDVGMDSATAVAGMFKSFSLASFVGLSKSSDVVKSMAQQYGNLNTLTDDQVDAVGQLAASNGLAGDEALNLTMAMGRMPGMTRETAANSEKMFKDIGKTKGVIPAQIMKEMAKNTQFMAIYSKGGAEGFAKAAASAKRMGIELSSVLNAAEKTLDFESSINAQMEASVLLGRELNMDRLRQASLSGDANAILQEQQNLMRQAGGLENMNVLQKKKLAEMMGLTVEEMQKINDEAKYQNEHFGEQADTLDKILGYSAKYGEALFTGFSKAAPLITGMASLMSVMNVKSIPGMVMGIYNMVKGLTLGVLQAGLLLAKFIALGAAAMIGKGGQAKKALFGEKGLGESIKGLFGKGAGGGLTPKAPETPGGGGGTEDKVNKASKIDMKKVLQGAAAILVLSAALYVAAKAFQEFASVKFEDVMLGIGAITALAGVAFLLSKAKGDMINGAIAVAILGAALIPAAFAFSLLAGVDYKSIAAFTLSIIALTLATIPMAALVTTGVLGLAAIGFAVLGASLIPFGIAAVIAGAGITLIASGMRQLTTIKKDALIGIGDGLLHIAKGLGAIGLSGALAIPALLALSKLGGTITTKPSPTAAPASIPAAASVTAASKTESSSDIKELVTELRALAAVLRAGGVINMDGKKVADVVQRNIRTMKFVE